MPLLKKFTPKKILIFLLVVSFGLFVIDIVIVYLGYKYYLWYSSKTFFNFHNLFSLLSETSIPTLFSILNLLFSSVLLWVIAKNAKATEGKNRYFWISLSVIFLFLAFDEGTQIHELIGVFTNSFFNFPLGHPLHYSWVIPYSILILIIGLIYFKFLFTLPLAIRNGIIAAGLLFVIAAIGLELVEAMELRSLDRGSYIRKYNFDRAYVVPAVQELMEMVAISFFNYILLKYIAMEKIKVEFSVPDNSKLS
ncbi:MAG: hypothetical protein ACR2NW_02190 [Thermodesulfobacteriota bacterium]